MSLSVCLLTRNDEAKIGQALVSAGAIADEILVGDIGSTDMTVPAASDLGARVVAVPWKDDYADAQNFLAAQAAGDWILWMLPEEELLAESWLRLRACVADPDVLGYFVRKQTLTRAGRPDLFTEAAEFCLYRRDAGLSYVGRCHAHFATPLAEIAKKQGKRLGSSDVVLRRHAYLSPTTPDRLRWTARLLELELRDRPGQLHYLIELGRTLLLLGDVRGHASMAEAMRQIFPLWEAPSAPTPSVQQLFEYQLTPNPDVSESMHSFELVRELALRWFPRSPPLFWMIAQRYFREGNFREAAGYLEQLVDFGKTGRYDRSRPFDPDILGGAALMNLGVCYRRLDERAKAEACFQQLLGRREHAEEAKRHLAELKDLSHGLNTE